MDGFISFRINLSWEAGDLETYLTCLVWLAIIFSTCPRPIANLASLPTLCIDHPPFMIQKAAHADLMFKQ